MIFGRYFYLQKLSKTNVIGNKIPPNLIGKIPNQIIRQIETT